MPDVKCNDCGELTPDPHEHPSDPGTDLCWPCRQLHSCRPGLHDEHLPTCTGCVTHQFVPSYQRFIIEPDYEF
jgi:hypothetical protein